jgi:hypothetical protein
VKPISDRGDAGTVIGMGRNQVCIEESHVVTLPAIERDVLRNRDELGRLW